MVKRVWKPGTPAVIANQVIYTNLNLLKAEELRLVFVDATSFRSWGIVCVDLDIVKDYPAAIKEGFALIYDNDYCRFYINDWERGHIRFSDHGREMRLAKASII